MDIQREQGIQSGEDRFMRRALELARQGIGYTSPNPLVGAVLVRNGRIIGEGAHQQYGGPHAEVNAINSATESVAGAELYVTLEPCNHQGKTPPCTELVIRSGIRRVVIAMEDPNPKVSGRGIKCLEQAGIEVCCGVLENEARALNRPFIKHIAQGVPYVLLKTAMTLDGKIATVTGESRWISGASARAYVHELRHQYTAIMVGIGTVLADDPSLTTRREGREGVHPIPIIVDSTARIPLQAKVLHGPTGVSPILATTAAAPPEKLRQLQALGCQVKVLPEAENGVDLQELMRVLGSRGIDSILLEGGGELAASALHSGIVDEVQTIIAPKILGGRTARTPVGGTGIVRLDQAIALSYQEVRQLGEDLLIKAQVNQPEKRTHAKGGAANCLQESSRK